MCLEHKYGGGHSPRKGPHFLPWWARFLNNLIHHVKGAIAALE